MPRYVRHVVLFCAAMIFTAICGEAQEIIPFGNAFAPSFSFKEDYDESGGWSDDDEDFVYLTSYALSFEARVSMAGIDRTIFDSNTHELNVTVGNLEVSLPFGDGTRSTAAGAKVIRWILEGLDPNTYDDLPRAGTVELRYDAEKLTVTLTLGDAWEDYSIIAPDLWEVEGPIAMTLPLEFTVGNHGFNGRLTYVRGATVFYDSTVQHGGTSELFEDLAKVHLTGEIDSTKPAAQIIEPAAGQGILTPTVTLRGIASDDHALASVSVKVNSGDFVPAVLNANGTWTLADVALRAGDNLMIVRSVDADGNWSDSLHTVRYVVLSGLSVDAAGTGYGTVTSGLFAPLNYLPTQAEGPRTAQCELGTAQTVVATAGTDSVFDGWTSNVPLTPEQASSPRLSFQMQPDMTLTAHFLRNPFSPIRGKYFGLLEANGPADRGVVNGKLGADGSFTLKAKIGRISIPVKGVFTNAGEFDTAVFVGDAVYAIHLRLNVSGTGQRQITGSIQGGGVDAAILADLSTYSRKLNPVPLAIVGSYNVLLSASEENTDPNFPVGNGFGRLSIGASGTANFTGRLADGTPVSCGGRLAGEATRNEHYFPLFTALYKRTGSISGRLIIDLPNPSHDVSGMLDWQRPAGIKPGKVHPEGFAGKVSLVGAKFERVNPGQLALLQGSEGTGGFYVQAAASAGLPSFEAASACLVGLDGSIVISPDIRNGIGASILAVNPKNGLLSGRLSEDGRVHLVKGLAVPRKLNRAGGYFVRGSRTARLEIADAP